MENLDSEFWISWICADYTPFARGGNSFFISNPSRENRFLGEDLFLNVYNQAINDGALREEEIDNLLLKYKIWNNDMENKLKQFIKNIEDIKVDMFKFYLNDSTLKNLRLTLKKTNENIEELARRKVTFDSLSAKSIAAYSRYNFLLGCSIFKSKNKPYWRNPMKSWNSPDSILEYANKILTKYNLADSDYRELARSTPWRNIWTIKKGLGNLFGRPLIDLSVHQKNLSAWSTLYDNVYKSQDVPPDVVINDDDLLDGWMINQRRKRENEAGKRAISDISNPKIAAADEVFIMAGADEYSLLGKDKFDIIYDMNDPMGKLAFKRRMAQLQKQGELEEYKMVDTQEFLRQEINKGARR